MSKTTTAKKDEKFDLPEWLTTDEYASKDFEVFVHPKTKHYIAARTAYDEARAEFDRLEVELLAPVDEETMPDLSVGDVDPRQERLEELANDLKSMAEEVNDLAAVVKDTRHEVHVADMLTYEEMADLTDNETGWFRELLARTATLDGRSYPAAAWMALERKMTAGPWAAFQADVMGFLSQPGVTPDFSPITSPKTLE